MKITETDFTRLQFAVKHFAETRHLQPRKNYPGMTVTRYIFDVFHGMIDACQAERRIEDYLFLRSLYDYLEDSHLETAMKKALASWL